MTPGDLILARDGDGDATAAALALWQSIVGAEGAAQRVEAVYASASLDLIGQHVGGTTDVPDALLGEAVYRLGAYLDNTEILLGRALLKADAYEFAPLSEFHGGPLRKSGVAALLGPWVTPVAGVI